MLVLAVSAAAVSVVACDAEASGRSSGRPAPRPTQVTSTTEPTSTSSAGGAATEAAVAAYVGMWNDFVAAAATSDWRSPKLGQYATGLALSTLSRGLYADHASGVISRGDPTHDIQRSSVDSSTDPKTVVITDCSDSSHALKYNARTGRPADDSPGGRHLIIATVRVQSDGTWKVVDFGVQGVGTC